VPRSSPTTDETTTTDPAEGSSAASSTGSDPFVGNTGPGFDPTRNGSGSGPDPVAADGLQPVLQIPEVTEDQIRAVLANGGDGIHALFGVGDFDWVMTQADLNRIAPPLTRIVNRYEPLQAAAGFSDEAAVAIGFGLYGWRTALERRVVARARRDGEHVPGEQAGATAPVGDQGDGVPENLRTLSVEEGYTPLGVRLQPEGNG
jgi:hypothetical protein